MFEVLTVIFAARLKFSISQKSTFISFSKRTYFLIIFVWQFVTSIKSETPYISVKNNKKVIRKIRFLLGFFQVIKRGHYGCSVTQLLNETKWNTHCDGYRIDFQFFIWSAASDVHLSHAVESLPSKFLKYDNPVN